MFGKNNEFLFLIYYCKVRLWEREYIGFVSFVELDGFGRGFVFEEVFGKEIFRKEN